MWPADLRGVVISFAYVAAVLAASELVRRLTGRGGEFTRKFVHIFIGLWIIPTLFLFTKWYWAGALPAAAVVGNFASQRLKLIRSIERPGKSDFGTVFFPLSFVICLWAFFHTAHPEAAAAGIVIMALGDAAAGIFGTAFGRHPYRLLGARKSLEGSAAMIVVSFAAALAVLLFFKAGVAAAVLTAAVVAIVGTGLEAIGKYGLDNLTVPVACSTVAFLMLRALEGVPQ